jgi:hypothetical protein
MCRTHVSLASVKSSQLMLDTVCTFSTVFILSEFFIYQLIHKKVALKRLKFTLKELRHDSVELPSSKSVLFEPF